MGLEAQELGSFDFALKNNTKIEVFYSLPKTINSDTRLVMVMHGRKRNGEEYRDQWVKKANELNLAIIVPQFPEEEFPGVFGFNYGNVFNESLEPTNNSIYDDLDSLVDSAISKFNLQNSVISDDDLKKSLSKYFLIMLGKSDTSTKPNTPYVASIFDKVTAQGQHRLDRGRNFFKGSIKKSKELDVFLKWGMVEVPTKDGHSNTQQMVPYAAELFYERLR
jgi:hypothetical protein